MTKAEIDAVRDWLRGEGYPLEYLTAREMARVGFRPWRGRHYKDPETGEYREVDVLAGEPDAPQQTTVLVFAECKHNSKPWLVLTEDVDLPPGYAANFLIKQGFDHGELLGNTDQSAAFLLAAPRRHGYNVVQTISGPDTPYAALHTVTKAALERISGLPRTHPAIAVPIIVVDGSLYQLAFEEDGAEILEPVLWQRVVWHGSSQQPRAVQVDVVTAEHLPTYLVPLRAATQALAQTLPRLAKRR
jgi:hypothetical protein